MRALSLLASLLFSGVLHAEKVVVSYLFVGDPLTGSEKALIVKHIGTPTTAITVAVRKADLDGDHKVDIVALVGGQYLTVFLKRGASFESHPLGLRTHIVTSKLQLDVVPGLHGRNEILAKVSDVCFVAYMSEASRRASGTPFAYERFECKDSHAYPRFVVARNQCLSEGGNWGPQGMSHHGLCVRTMADGGKSCTEAADCQGKCIYNGPHVPQGTPVPGKCSVSDLGFGCFNLVRDGKYAARLCAD
jgi:hypothetical protein